MKKALTYIRSIIGKMWNVDINIPLFIFLLIVSILGLLDMLYQALNLSEISIFVYICLFAVAQAAVEE